MFLLQYMLLLLLTNGTIWVIRPYRYPQSNQVLVGSSETWGLGEGYRCAFSAGYRFSIIAGL